MDSTRDLTDAALSAICRKCPNIEYISIDGNDKCKGHIGGTALDTLRVDKKLAKGLRVLHLVDQSSCLDKAVKALPKARKKLEITVGDTNKWGDGTIGTYLGGKTNVEFGGFGRGFGGGFGRWYSKPSQKYKRFSLPTLKCVRVSAHIQAFFHIPVQ